MNIDCALDLTPGFKPITLPRKPWHGVALDLGSDDAPVLGADVDLHVACADLDPSDIDLLVGLRAAAKGTS